MSVVPGRAGEPAVAPGRGGLLPQRRAAQVPRQGGGDSRMRMLLSSLL